VRAGVHVGELWRYPVKSMAGERLRVAEVGPGGIAGDRVLQVVDGRGVVVSARTHPRLLALAATTDDAGCVRVDGAPWSSPEVACRVRWAAGADARLEPVEDARRFDVLPLLVATDGAIAAFGEDGRRLRPNVVVAGVDGLAERAWEGTVLRAGDALVALHSLRDRCIVTTYDPDTVEQRVDVLRDIRRRFAGKLALNAWVLRGGDVRAGDAVELLGTADAALRPPLAALGRMAR